MGRMHKSYMTYRVIGIRWQGAAATKRTILAVRTPGGIVMMGAGHSAHTKLRNTIADLGLACGAGV